MVGEAFANFIIVGIGLFLNEEFSKIRIRHYWIGVSSTNLYFVQYWKNINFDKKKFTILSSKDFKLSKPKTNET